SAGQLARYSFLGCPLSERMTDPVQMRITATAWQLIAPELNALKPGFDQTVGRSLEYKPVIIECGAVSQFGSCDIYQHAFEATSRRVTVFGTHTQFVLHFF